MKHLSIFCLMLFMLALGFTKNAEANHSWGPYHWARSTNPLALSLGDNVSSRWDAHLAQASADWTLSVVLNTAVVPGNTNNQKGRNTPKNCVPTTGRGEVCNAKYGANGWLGIATIWASGDHITAGTVQLNDTYFNTATYNTTPWRNLVMCQEIGHIFGLAHQDENFSNENLGTCMDYTNNPESNQHPNEHDYAMLEEIYAHLDPNSSTVSTGTLAENSLDQEAWGKEIHRSLDGRVSLFEKDQGKGSKMFRHVFWAEPRGQHSD